ncbi:MAG: dCTP deaminase domain-containing protein [Gaiellaceae bacterium]
MVLSDRSIRGEIEAGRVVIDPYDPGLIQPSSIDVRVDRRFRVFQNSRYPYIDVRQAMEDLTELVQVDGDEPFILHPGEFVHGSGETGSKYQGQGEPTPSRFYLNFERTRSGD